MKKKIMICLILLILTGCKNQMKCTTEKQEENYVVKQEAILKYDKNDIITESELTINYEFENDEDAQQYYNILKQLDGVGQLTIDKNKVSIKDSEQYSDYSKKTELKKQLEANGYKCK